MAAQQLHASFPNLFFFFFLASSQTLGSYQMSYLQLLFLNNCCFSYSQQATHRAPPLKGKGGPVTLSVLFSRISAHHLLPRSTPSSFIFTSAFPSLVCLGKKKNILSPAHHLCHYCFFLPCVLYFLVRELFCVPTVFFHQCCCVCIPREAVADFHPIALTPVALGVSPVWSCTWRIWSSTFWGCTVRLMLEVKIFIYPVC